jgi:hypothetical protein
VSRRSLARVTPVATLYADPDNATLGRLGALTGAISRPLQGLTGGARGVDRGDPALSFGGPIAAAQSPTNAQAAVTAGAGAGYKPQQVIQDTALTDPTLDPYNALLLQRMGR